MVDDLTDRNRLEEAVDALFGIEEEGKQKEEEKPKEEDADDESREE